MEEKTCKGIQKSLTFDKSGETLSVEIHLKMSLQSLKRKIYRISSIHYIRVQKMLFFRGKLICKFS